ncbi:MAG: PhoX family protein, partial [bacterium]
MIFPGWDGRVTSKTSEMVEVEMAAVGLSIAEVVRSPRGEWSYVRNSPFNRRITASTPMALRGPAAGHALMQTSGSVGTAVLGTFNNCAGGVTPWGTVLSGEENIQDWFTGRAQDLADPALRALHMRYGVGTGRYGWARFHERFDITKEPHEPNRFGWIVEVDPYDPRSMPVKRTALGRFIHEGATTIVAPTGQPVAYMGDDGRYEYVYKFVASGRYDPDNRQANMHLLDRGTLYAARFREDGTGEWLPLVFGIGPLTPANGFRSQSEVVINARRAADLVGATKMDRPEDVEANPVTGKVYVVMTSNDRRTPEQVDRANPRANNRFGHIVELIEDGGDHTATRFRWEIFIQGGDPSNEAHRAYYQRRTDVSAMANPDNLAFVRSGRMWVATDGMEGSLGVRDGLFAVETEGSLRGLTRRFLSAPPGAEVAGPEFTPDGRTLFVSMQHPGRTGGASFA